MRHFPAQHNLQKQDVLYFSHIPKTAGMTFRTIVEDHFHEDETCPATLKAQIKAIAPEDFQAYRLFRGHLGHNNIAELVPGKRLINVTVMREPVARVISHYDYIRRMPTDPFYDAVQNMTLAEFASELPFGKLKKNVQTYYIAKLAQFDFDELPASEIFQLAKQGLDDCAFVGLVERFQDSLFLLSYIFGWRPIINTRQENAAKKKQSPEEIPASTIEVIKENSEYDIELYQYAKEIFEHRFNQMTQDLVENYLHQVEPDLTLAPDQPLSTELLAKLLDRHYNQRYADRQIPLAQHVAYDFAQPLRGAGWQRRERGGEGDFRWMGPGPTAILDLPLLTEVETDRVLEFRVIRANLTAPDIVQSLAVTVNGHPIDLYSICNNQGTQVYQGIIPKAILKTDRLFTELKFQVNRVISRREIDPEDPDTRAVGLALNYVQVFPISQRFEKSVLAQSFEAPAWKSAVRFLQDNLKPDDTVTAPLIFRAPLAQTVVDFDAFVSGKPAQWGVLHKGECDRLDALVPKLFVKGFKPVFANEVFVIFTTRRGLTSLSYLSEHVKPLYADFLKRMGASWKAFLR